MRYIAKGEEDPLPLSSLLFSPDSLKGFFRRETAARQPSQLREQWPPLLSPLLAIPENPRLDHQTVNLEFITFDVECIIKVSKQREKGGETA